MTDILTLSHAEYKKNMTRQNLILCILNNREFSAILTFIIIILRVDIKNHLSSLLENLKQRKDPSPIHKKLHDALKERYHDPSLSWPEKNASWNKFIESIFHEIPEKYALPIVIQMTDYTYTPKYHKGLRELVRLNPESLNDHYKARRAITGVCASFGVQHLKNAAFATDNAISMDILSKNEEVD